MLAAPFTIQQLVGFIKTWKGWFRISAFFMFLCLYVWNGTSYLSVCYQEHWRSTTTCCEPCSPAGWRSSQTATAGSSSIGKTSSTWMPFVGYFFFVVIYNWKGSRNLRNGEAQWWTHLAVVAASLVHTVTFFQTKFKKKPGVEIKTGGMFLCLGVGNTLGASSTFCGTAPFLCRTRAESSRSSW